MAVWRDPRRSAFGNEEEMGRLPVGLCGCDVGTGDLREMSGSWVGAIMGGEMPTCAPGNSSAISMDQMPGNCQPSASPPPLELGNDSPVPQPRSSILCGGLMGARYFFLPISAQYLTWHMSMRSSSASSIGRPYSGSKVSRFEGPGACTGCQSPSLPYVAYVLPPSTCPRSNEDVIDASETRSASSAYVWSVGARRQ